MAGRVGKLVRLLGFDHPGEVVGAAQALRRVLGTEGLDLNDLAQVLETATAPPTQPEAPDPEVDWVAMAYYCLDSGRGILSRRQREFVEDMTTLLHWREPTEKQAQLASSHRQQSQIASRQPVGLLVEGR